MRLIAISDTHEQLDNIELPDGDLLVHAGDATGRGTVRTVSEFNEALGRIKHKYPLGIIFVPGNHDWLFEREPYLARSIMTNATVLINESVVVNGLKIYGIPQQPAFCNWAFNVPRGSLYPYYDAIPDDTQLLITHGPPYGILDTVQKGAERLGCMELTKRVGQLSDLRNHVFGHIHGGYGQYRVGKITFTNASICTEAYRPTNKPIIIEV